MTGEQKLLIFEDLRRTVERAMNAWIEEWCREKFPGQEIPRFRVIRDVPRKDGQAPYPWEEA